MQWLSLVSTIRGTKHKVMIPATKLTKIAFPQINCNVKETLWGLQEKDVRCNRKPTFHYKGKLQEVFRAGLNKIKYDYGDSKQHFYLQCHVAATVSHFSAVWDLRTWSSFRTQMKFLVSAISYRQQQQKYGYSR